MNHRARAFSLIEAVVATLVVGGLFVAALSAVAAAKTGRVLAARNACGQTLALDLMAEILEQPYREGNFLGTDPGEATPGNRTLYDDVDDYAGLVDAPPRDRGGTLIPNASAYSRSVEVRWADPEAPAADAATDTGLKRVTVTVRFREQPVATLVTLRSTAHPDADTLFELPQ